MNRIYSRTTAPSKVAFLFLVLSLLLVREAECSQVDSRLTGTWVSKSGSVKTGKKFYNPSIDRIIEPKHTGISYSFTENGHYEAAYYRSIPNPANPQCPEAIMQWQHGTYNKFKNGTMVLTPYKADGRQVHSSACQSKSAVYSKYNQTEVFKRLEVFNDPYHNRPRLNLFRFDGSPLMPLYQHSAKPIVVSNKPLKHVKSKGGSAKRSVELADDDDDDTLVFTDIDEGDDETYKRPEIDADSYGNRLLRAVLDKAAWKAENGLLWFSLLSLLLGWLVHTVGKKTMPAEVSPYSADSKISRMARSP